MPTQQNSFDRGYAAIISAWQAWTPLMALVKVGNIQNLQTPGFQPRTAIGLQDRPELKLLEAGMLSNPFGVNSLAVDLQLNYPVQVATGQLGISGFNLIMWELFRAMTNAGPQLGLTEIKNWKMTGDASVKQADPQVKRPDWTAVAVVRVDFQLSRTDYLTTTYT